MAVRHYDLGPGIKAAVSDRWGGASAPPYDDANLGLHVGDDPLAVATNRARVAADLGLSGDGLSVDPAVWMGQAHGAGVAVVESAPTGDSVPGVDALVTGTVGLPLAVLVADCVPVLLADPEAGVVAVAHAGRRGVALGVVPATLAVMAELGARPQRMRAVLGPAIGGCCYEVSPELQDEVSAVVPAARASTRAGTPSLDLRAGLAAVLAGAGLAGVELDSRCTAEDPALFSYRRDGATGRFAGYVCLTG
ncbi:MAG: peptidoglycan editing factor PgeF [Mycobacteriales bacterium]